MKWFAAALILLAFAEATLARPSYRVVYWSASPIVTRLYTVPCEEPDLEQWLAGRFRGLPVGKADNVTGVDAVAACYVEVEDEFLVVLDVQDRVLAKVYPY